MSTRFEEVYRFGRDDILTDEALNRRFKDLDDRLSKAEVARLSEDQAFSLVLDQVLGRSEEVISSLRDNLLQITRLQWLTAHSETPRSLAVNAQFALEIVEADRELFAPGPYAVLSWTGGAPTDYAVVRTLGFDRDLGQWDVRVEAFTGAPGPWSDWQIAAVAGSTLAQMALLINGQAALAGALQARDDAGYSAAAAAAAIGVAGPAATAAAQAKVEAVAARADAVAAAAAAAASALSINPAVYAAQFAALAVVASAADIRGVAENTKKMTAKGYGDAQGFVDLGDITGTVTLDLKAGINFKGRLVGPVTFAEPLNRYDGYVGILSLTQDATGGRTAAFSTAIKKTSPVTLSTAANANDDLTLYCVGTVAKLTPPLKAFA